MTMLSKTIRISSFFAAASLSCALVASCGGGGGGGRVFADAIWQVRCPTGLAGCSTGVGQHNVFGFDGQDDGPEGDPGLVRASCTLNPLDGGNVAIAMSVTLGGASLQVRNAVVPEAGGTIIGTGCNVTVVEDSVTYSGQCGSGVPSAAQPCQISNISLDPRNMDGPTLTASVLCQNVTSPSDPTRFIRDVERGTPAARGTAAPLRFIHCAGL